MSQCCSTTSSARPSIGGWSLRRPWMRNSRRRVSRLASATRLHFLRLELTKTMCIFWCNRCRSTVRSGWCKSSKASRQGKSSPPARKSRNNYGADNSGAPGISSARSGSMAMKRALRNTFRIKAQNTSNYTGNNSTYSDTSQLAAG